MGMLAHVGWTEVGDRIHRRIQATAEGPTSMKEKSGSTCRIRNARLMRFARLLLLAIVWPSGLYLLLGRVEPFSGLFLLFAGIWLLLDNPLEFLAAFSGPCPACGAEVRTRGRSPCRCLSCGTAIQVERGRLSLARPEEGPTDSAPEDLAAAGKDSPFAGPHPFAPGDTLDLHTFSPREVAPLLDDFFDLCEQAGISRARIIHGKGMGVLRQRVRALLARNPRVLSYQDAPAEAGGWGATVVELGVEVKRDARGDFPGPEASSTLE
jgi:hypothetical protein